MMKNGQKHCKSLELDESLSSDMQEKYPFIKEQISKEKSKIIANPENFQDFLFIILF